MILKHLTRTEGLLQSSLASQRLQLALPSSSPATSNDTNFGNDDTMARSVSGIMASVKPLAVGLGSELPPSISISTMPKLHTTLALHLLQWPLIRDLVSESYNPQNLLHLEMTREPLRMTPSFKLDLTNAPLYVKAFFDHANVWYACANPYTWERYYRAALAQGLREGPIGCLVLLVLALRNASQAGSIAFVPADCEPPVLAYFAAAWNLLPSVMMRNSAIATQCMVLAPAYLFYLVRPLEAWTLLSNVSMKLRLLFGNSIQMPLQCRELNVRVYWNGLLYESHLLAELDLPHSGIVDFEESVDLPGEFREKGVHEDIDLEGEKDSEEQPTSLFGQEPAGRDELWYFLAEIALRRLLNRVSHLIYRKDGKLALSALGPIASELDFQLSQWHESLPRPVQFSLTQTSLSSSAQTVLRLRYHACRTIIYRPYILAGLENEDVGADPGIREFCRRCLDASLRQLEHTTSHRQGHLPYLWQGAMSMVSQLLLIMGATMSQTLSTLLPAPSRIDGMIASVVDEVAG